jgi:hypothetical protein
MFILVAGIGFFMMIGIGPLVMIVIRLLVTLVIELAGSFILIDTLSNSRNLFNKTVKTELGRAGKVR